ncbi:hypothetical protein PROFUN_05842 [Planoprotostelium fungivorum]|uniref:Uncharacterized protein n=1 Tax=Planoprotostelium fungivorum TaxID=1890364 RepID=A0A2P6NKL2_9EUKA|nr:hypothetical protein PROFUN_05842 [Planoprotostelium fungivorum]
MLKHLLLVLLIQFACGDYLVRKSTDGTTCSDGQLTELSVAALGKCRYLPEGNVYAGIRCDNTKNLAGIILFGDASCAVPVGYIDKITLGCQGTTTFTCQSSLPTEIDSVDGRDAIYFYNTGSHAAMITVMKGSWNSITNVTSDCAQDNDLFFASGANFSSANITSIFDR